VNSDKDLLTCKTNLMF